MEAHAKDSEDEEDIGQRSANHRSRVRCTPNLRNDAKTPVNPDVDAPMQSPIPNFNRGVFVEGHLNSCGHIWETSDADSKTHYITVHGGPDSSISVISAKADVSASIETPSVINVRRKSAVVRNMNSPNPSLESEEKCIGARTLDNKSDATDTPNMSRNSLGPSKVDKGKHQEKDAPLGDFVPAAVRSNIDNKFTNEHTSPNSGGDPVSNSINNPSNSEKASQKLLALERCSYHHTTSHQKTEESTLRVDSNNSSLEMGQRKVGEHADTQSMKNSENRNVDGPDAAYAQQMKNLNSPTSLKLQREDMVSDTSPLHCPFATRLSDASETVIASSAGTNLAEDIAVDLGKQQSSLSTSRQSRPRKTLLKNTDPVNEGKLTEFSSCGKNVKSPSKSRTPPNAMKKNKSTMSSSGTVQDRKTSAGFSYDNMGGKNAESIASAVNQDCLYLMGETGNAHVKDHASDISQHGSRNSQIVSCSGIAETTVTGLDGNGNEVAAPTITVSSDANVKEGAKQFQNASSNVQGETSHSKKDKISAERIAGAKRPRGAFMEIDGSYVDTSKKIIPESRSAEVVPPKHDATASENGCSTASAAEPKAISPKKVPRVRNTVAKRTRNALTKMDDARVAPNLEISQENTELNPKVSDIANAVEHKNNPPKKLPNTRVRNTAAKKSQKSVTNKGTEALVAKTETAAAESLFDDLFPEDNVEDCPKMVSSSASAGDCRALSPKNVLNPRVRNAVAKRKMNSVERKIGSKCGKVGSVIASVAKAVSSKRMKEMPCNFNKVTAEQDFEKDNTDGMRDLCGLFCQDSTTDDKTEGHHNSKMRSRKRNEVLTSDHKKNRQDNTNLNSEANARTGSLCPKFDAKSMTKGACVLGKLESLKGNECKTSVMSEPALFILSGNRQQRAEYRSILRRLKGRVCRDSHHWSYQATHFIASEPLRRTEKFFAAAAAGR
jgi:topoisomerase (DNA) II binding protein 1